MEEVLDLLTIICDSCFQDDYRVCLKYNIISKDMDPICPVDMSGRFTEEVTHFKNQYVKVSRIYTVMGTIW